MVSQNKELIGWCFCFSFITYFTFFHCMAYEEMLDAILSLLLYRYIFAPFFQDFYFLFFCNLNMIGLVVDLGGGIYPYSVFSCLTLIWGKFCLYCFQYFLCSFFSSGIPLTHMLSLCSYPEVCVYSVPLFLSL